MEVMLIARDGVGHGMTMGRDGVQGETMGGSNEYKYRVE
jgi:hypothetical protein